MNLSNVSLGTLVKICAGVTGFCWCGMLWIDSRNAQRVKEEEYYSKPVMLLRNYTPAEHFLGKPILSGKAQLLDHVSSNETLYSLKLTIPVRGPINKGTLYVEASRDSRSTEEWDIDKLDLEVKGTKQRWTFYKREAENFVKPQQPEQGEQADQSQS